MKALNYFILIGIFFSCGKNDDYLSPEEFYNRNKDRDFRILFNLMLIPRGGDGKTIQKIQVNRKEGDPLTLPVFDAETDSVKILDSVIFDIKTFAKENGVSESNAYQFAKMFSDSVLNTYYSSGAITIKSYPDLGSFIIFQVTPEDEVIYLKDQEEIFHDYWKHFFQNAKKFDEHWYYRKIVHR